MCSALPGPQQKEERKGTLIKRAIGAMRGGAAIAPSICLLTRGSFPYLTPPNARNKSVADLHILPSPWPNLGLPGEMAPTSKGKVGLLTLIILQREYPNGPF